MKKLLTLFVAIIATCALWASNVITYTASEKLTETTGFDESTGDGTPGLDTNAFNVSITSHTFSDGTGTITFSGVVTSIGNYAFYGCFGLTSITIPGSVTSIGRGAFVFCHGLTSITIPESVTSIGGSAFSSCSGLTSITIPNSVTSIGYNAFQGCSELTSVIWNAKNCESTYYNSGYYSYFGPFYDIRTQITNFLFGENVEFVPDYLCDGMENLTSVTLPISVKRIGNSSFYGCSSLTSITIPNSVTSIGEYAFSDCSGLTSVTIGNSVTSIGYEAFSGCSGLTSITIPNSVTSIGNSAFSYCSGLTSITIPNSVTSIGSSAFYDCSGLTSITIPNSVTSIGSGAFYRCSGLTSITIPNSVTSIGEWAFLGCSNLTAVHITDVAAWCGISFDGSSANPLGYAQHLYLNGEEVTNLVIPNSVTSINNYAFHGGSSITSVTIPNSVTSIGEGAFFDCSGLTSVTIPNSVTYIGGSAFYGCSSLTAVTIPNSVTSIGSYAFYGCSSLTSVTIPNSVTSIGELAFYGCSGLTSITCLATNPPMCRRDCFRDVQKNIPVYIPCYSAHLYKQASQWNNFTNIQQIDGCADLEIIVMSSNDTLGSVIGGGEYAYMANVEIEATPTAIAHFDHWSDGNTDNPRTLVLTQDTAITAIFEYNWCGENCYWGFDNGTLTIYGSGTMNDFTAETIPWDSVRAEVTTLVINDGVTSIGDYAFSGCSNRAFNTLVLPHSVETIGDYAFANCSRLTSASFGSELTEVGDYAFSGCSRISEMTCYAETTPDAYDNSFSGVKTAAYLYVPCDSKRAYTFDPYWGVFDIQCIGAETTTVTTSTVEVVAGDNEAVFKWPTDNNAASYSLTITKDGIVFCTLTFNANGQLTGIAFAPGRDGASRTQSATTSAAGMSFTVTGLNGATAYAFLFETKNAASQVIASYNGNFATTGYVEPTPSNVKPVQIDVDTPVKVVREGQVLIWRGDRLYDLRGQEVK